MVERYSIRCYLPRDVPEFICFSPSLIITKLHHISPFSAQLSVPDKHNKTTRTIGLVRILSIHFFTCHSPHLHASSSIHASIHNVRLSNECPSTTLNECLAGMTLTLTFIPHSTSLILWFIQGSQSDDSPTLWPSSIDWKSVRSGSRNPPMKMKFNRSIGSIPGITF